MRLTAAAAALLAAALAVAPAERARAEIPALSREFTTESFLRTPHDLALLAARRHVALGVSGGAFWAGDDPGSWNAFRSGSPWGGRIEALARRGRFTLEGDATNDGRLDGDPREYPQRLTGAAAVPEARVALTGAVGWARGRHRGTDLSAELAPLAWQMRLRTADLAPRLWLWARYRVLEGDPHPIVTPAAAVALQHFVVLGSQPVLALSAQTDLQQTRAPAAFGMLQAGFASVPVPLTGGGGDPDMPRPRGAPAPSLVDRSWFVTLGYAFPLDDRSAARFAVQAGMRFVRPYGGS